MQKKKPEKIKHKNVILQFYGAKNRKITFQKFCGARKKKKIYAKNIREDTKSEKIKNKNVILQNNIFHNHIFLCKKIRR